MAYTKKEIENIWDSIINRVEEGESLRAILRDDDMPSRALVYQWIDSDGNKLNQYARATQLRADFLVDEIIEISDNSGKDKIKLADGREVIDHEAIQRDRLKVDSRKWAASKMNPKKYGDKMDITSGNEKLESSKQIHLKIGKDDIDLTE